MYVHIPTHTHTQLVDVAHTVQTYGNGWQAPTMYMYVHMNICGRPPPPQSHRGMCVAVVLVVHLCVCPHFPVVIVVLEACTHTLAHLPLENTGINGRDVWQRLTHRHQQGRGQEVSDRHQLLSLLH